MFSFFLFLLFLSINTAAVVGEPKFVKRECVGGCYPTNDKHCASDTDGFLHYTESPANKCFIDTRLGGYIKYECVSADKYRLNVYSDEQCNTLDTEGELQDLGCVPDTEAGGMRLQLLRELPDNKLEIELCSVSDSTCESKYEISTDATECTSFNNGNLFLTWGSKGELIIYGSQDDCQSKTLFRASMIAKNIRNKKPVVYYTSRFITCNDLPVATPPKKLEIFKCADPACGECAAEDSASYETYTNGECVYNTKTKSYFKYECTKNKMVQTNYNAQSGGCSHSQHTTSSSFYGGCSRPYVTRGRSYGPNSDSSGINIELCVSQCENYTLAKGTTTCTAVGDTTSFYTWKADTLTIYSSSDDCTADNKFARIFVATSFDKPSTSTLVYEQSMRILCGGEGENSLLDRTPQTSLTIAACGDGNPTDEVDKCGVHKEGQCAAPATSSSSSISGGSEGLYRSMTTHKCLWDDKKKHYYMSICNATTYGVYNFGNFACDEKYEGVLSIEWGDTGCAESKLPRRARFVETKEDNKVQVEYCFNTSCGQFVIAKNSPTCSPMGGPTNPESTLPKTMYYKWDGTLTIYATQQDCTNDSPSRPFTRAFVAAAFGENSNVIYTPYQYVMCDGKPIVETTTTSTTSATTDGIDTTIITSTNNTNETDASLSGCIGFAKTQMILMALVLLLIYCF